MQLLGSQYLQTGIEKDSSTIVSFGDFSLIDDKSNGQLSPKKQKLVEKMSIKFGCTYNDIQEDTKNNLRLTSRDLNIIYCLHSPMEGNEEF
jgi:hypothetical protein